MEDFISVGQVILPFVIAGIAISIISALIVNYLSKDVRSDKEEG